MARDRQRSNAKTPGHRAAVRLYPTKGKKCFECKSKRDLTRDHIDHDPSNNSPENIRILCRKCHGKKDANYRWRNHSKTKGCKTCGKVFEYKRARQKTCSNQCRRKLQVITLRKGKEI